MPPSGGAALNDPKLAEVIAAQMDGADMFLLTKTDISGETEIAEARSYLAATQSLAPVLVARADDPDILAMLLTEADGKPGRATTATPHDQFISMAADSGWHHDDDAFRQTCACLFSGDIIRGKGFVHFADGSMSGSNAAVWSISMRRPTAPTTHRASFSSEPPRLMRSPHLRSALGFSRLKA